MREESFEKRVSIVDEASRHEWLKYRIHLFNTVSAPSIFQHDAHVVFFLARGDEWVYKELKTHDHCYPVYSDGDIQVVSTKALKKLFPAKPSYILRMDSDDAIHKDFFDFEAKMNSYIVQPWGVKWDGIRTSTIHYPSNPFITVYTKKHLTPFFGPHTSIMKKKNPLVLERDPMWLMNIHGRNVMNHFNRKDVDWTPVDLTPFGISGG